MTNLGLQQGVDDPRTAGLVSTAEAATLQLEFRYLSHVTENPIYWDKVEQVGLPDFGIVLFKLIRNPTQVMKVLKNAKQPSNLVPIYMKYVVWNFDQKNGSKFVFDCFSAPTLACS